MDAIIIGGGQGFDSFTHKKRRPSTLRDRKCRASRRGMDVGKAGQTWGLQKRKGRTPNFES